ncbi:MAG TPA: SDR family oxidoreductase [Alphaproteobacteria bacterium]|nr:SDR family oxidoreductase [Alphaproteobacteria bacterium]
MSKILVTGAGGYIGTTLVPMLLERGFKVCAVDRYFFGKQLLAPHPHLELIKEDVRHLTPAHFKGIGAVIDLAAVSNDPSGELFQDATWQINHQARANAARLAKQAGVLRYILPSSCSLYGFQAEGVVADESTPTNPLTTYAKANEAAEKDVLPLNDKNFTTVVLRQATVYGFSPRMRFDVAINGMTYGAWKTKTIPLMRDGTQWRPFVHVRDTASAMIFMLTADPSEVGGQIFNVGSEANVYQIKPLAERVVQCMPFDVKIEWYGDPDHRSYCVSFGKIEKLGWRATRTVEDGVKEIVEALSGGKIDKTAETLTLEWYKTLRHWQEMIREVELYGGILDIEEDQAARPALRKVGS